MDEADSWQARVHANMGIDAPFLRAPHPNFSRRRRARTHREHDQLGGISYVQQMQWPF